jgi:CRP/FNR family transcriptional regulator, cyclic AMP receptor protein
MKIMKAIIKNEKLADDLRKTALARKFQTGEEIFAEGDEASFLPIIIKGKVKMVRFPEVGKEVIISIFGDGEMFAVPPVFDGEPYPATAIAMEKTELLLLYREDFLRLLRESHEFSFAVIGWMCEMLREKTSVIKNLATASPEHRVGNVLLRLAEKENSNFTESVKISLRRQDIAEMAGLTTETTIRTARKLAEKDLIKIVRGKIILDDAESLRRFLDS